jgi:transmembrane sensor
MRDAEQVSKEAADWFARLLSRPVVETTRVQFAKWIVQSPAHVRAYLAITRTWTDVGQLEGLPGSNALLKQAAEASGGKRQSLNLKAHRATFRRWYTHAAAAAIAATLVGVSWMASSYWREGTAIETAVGEQRTVTLEDGSVLQVNTHSRVTYRLSPYEREIHLARGEAQFIVARDPSRPFVVITPHSTIRALGTVFNVQLGEEETAVAVLEGQVQVDGRVAPKPQSGTASAPDLVSQSTDSQTGTSETPRRMVLKIGEKAAVTSAGYIVANGGPPLERMKAWPERRLVFNDETLSDVVAEFNRYGHQPLRIADPELAHFRITGSFATYDQASLISYLEQYEGIVAQKEAGGEQVLFAADLVRVRGQ